MSREQDARVAEALGLDKGRAGVTHSGTPCVVYEPFPYYSTVPADALAALEALRERGLYIDIGMERGRVAVNVIDPNHQGEPTAVTAPDFCTAAVNAILAWADARGGKP